MRVYKNTRRYAKYSSSMVRMSAGGDSAPYRHATFGLEAVVARNDRGGSTITLNEGRHL